MGAVSNLTPVLSRLTSRKCANRPRCRAEENTAERQAPPRGPGHPMRKPKEKERRALEKCGAWYAESMRSCYGLVGERPKRNQHLLFEHRTTLGSYADLRQLQS